MRVDSMLNTDEGENFDDQTIINFINKTLFQYADKNKDSYNRICSVLENGEKKYHFSHILSLIPPKEMTEKNLARKFGHAVLRIIKKNYFENFNIALYEPEKIAQLYSIKKVKKKEAQVYLLKPGSQLEEGTVIVYGNSAFTLIQDFLATKDFSNKARNTSKGELTSLDKGGGGSSNVSGSRIDELWFSKNDDMKLPPKSDSDTMEDYLASLKKLASKADIKFSNKSFSVNLFGIPSSYLVRKNLKAKFAKIESRPKEDSEKLMYAVSISINQVSIRAFMDASCFPEDLWEKECEIEFKPFVNQPNHNTSNKAIKKMVTLKFQNGRVDGVLIDFLDKDVNKEILSSIYIKSFSDQSKYFKVSARLNWYAEKIDINFSIDKKTENLDLRNELEGYCKTWKRVTLLTKAKALTLNDLLGDDLLPSPTYARITANLNGDKGSHFRQIISDDTTVKKLEMDLQGERNRKRKLEHEIEDVEQQLEKMKQQQEELERVRAENRVLEDRIKGYHQSEKEELDGSDSQHGPRR